MQDPSDITNDALEKRWKSFIADHNNRLDRYGYIRTYLDPQSPYYDAGLNQVFDPSSNDPLLQHAFNKLVKIASFPDNDTVKISLRDFSKMETMALLIYFDQKQISSTMRWTDGFAHLFIKDSHNDPLKPPVKTIRTAHEQLQPSPQSPPPQPPPTATRATWAQATAKPENLYIPPFNVLSTDKEFYILLDYMQATDTNLLEKALQSRRIEYTEEDSDTCGHVYAVRFKHMLELAEMREESRTPANLNRAPQNAEIFKVLKGCPINLLPGSERIYIPLERMLPSQINTLESKLHSYLRLPYHKKDDPDFGPVFSFEESDENRQKLMHFSRLMRAEYKSLNHEKPTSPRTPDSSSLQNEPRPA